MNKDDCQVEFYFSFEKCDEVEASEFCFKKWAEKIGFLFICGRSRREECETSISSD